MYRITKTFPYSLGLSCAFRQWRAKDTHCRFLHGYALEVELAIVARDLDEHNWVRDFGDFDRVRRLLREMFDHRTIVAKDDPELETFRSINNRNLIQLLIVDQVGCEAFALYIFQVVAHLFVDQDRFTYLEYVTVREHGANSATYFHPDTKFPDTK